MQECPASSPGPVYNFFRQDFIIAAVVSFLVSLQLHNPGPTPAQPDHLVTFPQCADGNRPNGRVQPGYIAPTGKDTDHPIFGLYICHNTPLYFLSGGFTHPQYYIQVGSL
jgi:hypothetical protein